jgi:hypothetical protein
MCGFSPSERCALAVVSLPSPPELMDVPTNSVATTGERRSSKSAFRSHTQLLWMSPVSTTAFVSLRRAIRPSRRLRAAM